MDVFFYEAFTEEAAELKQRLPAGVRAGFARETIQESGHGAPPARLISLRTQSKIPPAWFASLDGVLARTTGWDHLAGFPVPSGHLPEYCTRAVAEHAMLLWTALLRRLPRQMMQFERFDRDGLTGSECAGRRLLVVGVGRIGREIVRLGRALDMTVRGVDVIHRHVEIEYVTPSEGIPWADVIVCAMNLTPENRGWFGGARLAAARRGAIFVNVARGELSPANDLARWLDDGTLGGVGLDVYEDEPRLAVALRAGQGGFPLAGRPDAILTPHNAFNTGEAVARKARQTVEEILGFLRGHRFSWPPGE
ncbi:MAG: hydroxyacid dehydrogenase [Verrucomicrobiae bacterium]|nr:hydroxyacid dehydrogenase [Verrucomicrobiae bacterium]